MEGEGNGGGEQGSEGGDGGGGEGENGDGGSGGASTRVTMGLVLAGLAAALNCFRDGDREYPSINGGVLRIYNSLFCCWKYLIGKYSLYSDLS